MSLKRTTKPGVMHTVGHTTPAVMHAIASVNGTRGARSSAPRRRRSAAKTSGSAPRKRRAKTGGKLKAGSAAAKAWGAKMRRLRKRK